jgi:uncharacterized membrane protein
MITVERSVVINKPVEVVFAYVSDNSNDSKWQAGVESVIPEGPANVVGSKWTEVRKFMGQEMRSTLEVTAFVANSKIASKVIKGPVPFEARVTFEASGGGTKVTTRVEGEPKGFFKVAEGALRGQLEKSLDEDGKSLKAILEAA